MAKKQKKSATKSGAGVSSKLHIRLLGDRVLVRPFEKKGEATTASGIIIPGKEANEKHERGVVVATGPGRFVDGKREPIECKVGDTIWFKRSYDVEEVEIAGEDHVMTSITNVLAIEN